MSNIQVSVLMTAFNREKYITEAIESVLASTYKDFELIIVDDCSTDKTVQIAREFEAKDSRVKLYVNEINLGDYPNRNKAASYASGKYIKYVDADDLIYPRGLELLVNYMEKYPDAGYGLCSLDQDKNRIFPFILQPEEAYKRHYCDLIDLFHKAPLSSIIRKDVFERIGGFSGKEQLGDFEMWNLLSLKHSVLLMPHGIVWYREHEEQQMSAQRKDPYIAFKYLLMTDDILNYKDCPLDVQSRNFALQVNQSKKAKSILTAFRYYGIKKGLQLKSKSKLSWFKIVQKII